ncbi:allophanate hydrolase subunit 1 [Kytococcus sedentarius]|uniref:5-oxoprolinase subunit B family protein n=1 Tax=Kytococcus sedentarius TaxID=1276 RepID=UPI0035BC709D
MRLLPSGTRAVLVELDDLTEARAWHAALEAHPPPGTLDLVPAARTVMVVSEPGTDLAAVRSHLEQVQVGGAPAASDEVVRIPVVYDGEDLADVAELLGIDTAEVVRRHTSEEWAVAFAGYAPGFGYCAGTRFDWDVARRSEPRTAVPAGSVALAGEFTGVYPRKGPGGWQLIGRTDERMFDPDRDPAALLRPGVRVVFEAADA